MRSFKYFCLPTFSKPYTNNYTILQFIPVYNVAVTDFNYIKFVKHNPKVSHHRHIVIPGMQTMFYTYEISGFHDGKSIIRALKMGTETLKRRCTLTRLHGAITQKAVICNILYSI
jgi:hypothetical protein